MSKPRISVIIPSYNHEKYVVQAVESVLAQSNADSEVIVLDDGSTDNSVHLLSQFGDKIRLVTHANMGQAATRNKGIQLATGEFIAFLDSDDLYLPGKLEAQVQFFEEHPETDVVYSDYELINAKGDIIRLVQCPELIGEMSAETIIECNFICNATVMVRKKWFDQVGDFNVDIAPTTDLEMWLRLIAFDASFGYIATPTVKYRYHAGNQSRDFRLMRYYRDIAHTRAFESLTAQGKYLLPVELNRLAGLFVRQFSFGAAVEAMRKSVLVQKSAPATFKLILFQIINSSIVYELLAFLQNIKRLCART